MRRLPYLFLAAILLFSAQSAPAQTANVPLDKWGLHVYETRYYIMHTDLDVADAREAAIRMTRMAEEYHARTSDFSGDIRQKLPFYLFKHAEDYRAHGGIAGSAGVFDGKELMAVAGDHPDDNTWHVVQHEGFHQFAAAVIGGRLPIWLNEGLAEYFGEAVFTGDSFVSGLIPPMRLRRVRAEMSTTNADGFKPIADLMTITSQDWIRHLTIINYDQSWSIVHFLAHADDGKYQHAFVNFMRLLSRNVDWQQAWQATFGGGTGFEDRWRGYWHDLPDRPTDALYAQANVLTLTSFVGRCAREKQTFADFNAFLTAIDSKSLKISEDDWLPPALIERTAAVARRREEEGTTYSLSNRPLQIICTLGDGTKIIGRYSHNQGSETTADITPPRIKK